MSDLDKLLRDSLKSVGDSYRPPVTPEVRARFRTRLRRRRVLIAAGGVAVAGAAAAVVFLFVAQVPQPAPRREVAEQEVASLEVVEEGHVAVSGSPDGMAVGDEGLWVVNSEQKSVQLISPESNSLVEELAVVGDPEDIAVAGPVAWVSDKDSGRLTKLELESDPVPLTATPLKGSLDLAPTEDGSLWVASRRRLYKVDAGDTKARLIAMGLGVTDVASGDESVWVLDDAGDQIARLDTATEGVDAVYPLDEPVGSDNSDLAVGAGRVWVASAEAGTLIVFDPATEEVLAKVEFEGSYAAVAVDEEGAWLMSGGGGTPGSLVLVDADTGEVVGDPLVLSGDPVDVAAGNGAAWVSDGATGTVLRVTTAPAATP